jgi:hypothetical protein
MRALYSILIALAVTGSTLPAFGAPFWQKHNPAPASAQPGPAASAPVQNNLMGQAPTATPGAGPQLHLIGPGPHKGDWLRKYLGLSPSQQEKSLEQDPSFRALPADKQKHLLERLHMFNSLAPDKQQKILNRMEIYEHLPPEKQAEAQVLFRRYQGLPADQQGQVSQAFRKMRDMSPEQRTQYLNSDEVRNGFNDEQRELLRGMTELAVSPVR